MYPQESWVENSIFEPADVTSSNEWKTEVPWRLSYILIS